MSNTRLLGIIESLFSRGKKNANFITSIYTWYLSVKKGNDFRIGRRRDGRLPLQVKYRQKKTKFQVSVSLFQETCRGRRRHTQQTVDSNETGLDTDISCHENKSCKCSFYRQVSNSVNGRVTDHLREEVVNRYPPGLSQRRGSLWHSWFASMTLPYWFSMKKESRIRYETHEPVIKTTAVWGYHWNHPKWDDDQLKWTND